MKVAEFVSRAERQAVIARLARFEVEPDPDFDRLTRLAARLLDAPLAFVSVVDPRRQWFRSALGTDIHETPVELSFCAHAVAAGDDVLIVEDATADPRFADNPLVTGEMHLRFYAGVPVIVDGERIGTLCVVDRKVRTRPEDKALDELRWLAGLASSLFALKDATLSGAQAQRDLLREEKRRAIALEAASLASWVWHVGSGWVECDVSLPALFNLPPANRLRAREIFLAIDRRDVMATGARFREAFTSSDDYFGEYRVRDAQPTRWLAARGRVVERDSAGKPTLIFGVNYDITARKTAEENQRLMLRELNHRVKNTLATVQALATQTVRHARDPREFLDAFSARLQAIGMAHGLLSDNEWRGISLAELVARQVAPYDPGRTSHITASGDDVFLSPDQALGLGMVLHELASNALKHGALSVPAGTVNLEWNIRRREGHRWIELVWQESGGPPVAPPERQGFGSILIERSLAKVLDSQVRHEFLPEGVRAAVAIPMGESGRE